MRRSAQFFKASLAVPHIHQSADDSLGLPVGSRPIDAGKLLTDTVPPASFYESMVVSSFKFACTSIPMQQVAVETACPDQGTINQDQVKELRELLKSNYRSEI